MSSDSEFLFTSESVTEGHPDKIADQVSDGVLDAVLKDDPYARVACETLVTTGLVVVAGEITTSTFVDIPAVVRETVRRIGYDDATVGFDCDTCAVISTIDRQSPDIAQGVSEAFEHRAAGSGDELDVAGAGDGAALAGAVALHFRARAFDAQQFGGEGEVVAVDEVHFQALLPAASQLNSQEAA